jgi:hypothetical protein
MKCSECGRTLMQIAQRGNYLQRTSPKGQTFVGHCAPSCKPSGGGRDAALLRAIEPRAKGEGRRIEMKKPKDSSSDVRRPEVSRLANQFKANHAEWPWEHCVTQAKLAVEAKSERKSKEPKPWISRKSI